MTRGPVSDRAPRRVRAQAEMAPSGQGHGMSHLIASSRDGAVLGACTGTPGCARAPWPGGRHARRRAVVDGRAAGGGVIVADVFLRPLLVCLLYTSPSPRDGL